MGDATTSAPRRGWIPILAAAIVLYVVQRDVLVLVAIGVVLGVMLDAVAAFGQRRLRMHRAPAVVVAALLFLMVVIGMLVTVAVPIVEQGAELAAFVERKLPDLQRRLERDYPSLLRLFPPMAESPADQNQVPKSAVAKAAVVSAANALGWLADALATFFLGLFLAWDPPRWIRGIAGLWGTGPPGRRIELVCTVVDALRSYLFVLMVYIFAMAAMWTLGLWLIGIDYPLVFGAIGGLAEIVPYLGPLIALLPPLIFATTLGVTHIAAMIALYVVLHILEGYVLVPYVLHRREHLPPPLVVLSILVFGALLGPLGVVIALPLGLVCYVLAEELVYARREGDDDPTAGGSPPRGS